MVAAQAGRDVVGSVGYYWRQPRELIDRLSSEWERRHEGPGAPSTFDAAAGPASEAIHELLGSSPDCAVCSGFEAVSTAAFARLPGHNHHDAGLGTMQAAWCATRHLRPERVVETGVARGLSSAAILSAMAANGRGHLWSIDLPEVNLVRSGEAGAAVGPALAPSWSWSRGSSRRLLAARLSALGQIDLFLHDSLHTRTNMLFEMRLAWAHLRPGGLLLVDDADHNTAFEEFAAQVAAPFAVRTQGNRSGAFGALSKV